MASQTVTVKTARNKWAEVSRRHYWHAPVLWPGSTVYVIGGGPSLRGVDWEALAPQLHNPSRNRRCIGCNDAYRLGPWVDCCYFGDYNWFFKHWYDEVDWGDGNGPRPGLRQFAGLVVTNCARLFRHRRVRQQLRVNNIWCSAPRVGWWGNTGMTCINFAWQMGAKRVVLLGFDMALAEDGSAQWHPNLVEPVNPGAYAQWAQMFPAFTAQKKTKAPELEVINANPCSELDLFPKVTLEEALA